LPLGVDMKAHPGTQSRRGRRWFPARYALALLSLLAVSVLATGVGASIMMKLELPDLVKLADHIAVVDVTSVRSAWDEKHERIYSTIELGVVDSWKAPTAADGTTPKPTVLTIVQPGGTVGDMSMVVMGMGTFVPGARSLVFLHGSPAHAQVVGMTQGVHPLRFEPTAKRWTVAPASLAQLELVRPAPRPGTPVSPGNASAKVTPSPIDLADRVPLDTMKAEVLRLIHRAP
jgi:hypothetical protein